jgi:hypothetical protein
MQIITVALVAIFALLVSEALAGYVLHICSLSLLLIWYFSRDFYKILGVKKGSFLVI